MFTLNNFLIFNIHLFRKDYLKCFIKDVNFLHMINSKGMTNTFDNVVNVIKKDPKVRIKINDTLDRYMNLPYKYRSEIGYDCLIQNIVLKEMISIMATTITDLDIELKMKISGK